MASRNMKSSYTVYDDHTTGTVEISEDVLSAIAAIAATEVEGVACLIGGITHEKAPRIGARSLSRAVKVEVSEGTMTVRLIIIMKYGYNIPETTKKVQEKVKSALEEMTDFSVSEVGVSVADVQVDKTAK
ncbi:MAG: Asp23/Gls24 family envelope stress response protein [Eubacteriales bacterium]